MAKRKNPGESLTPLLMLGGLGVALYLGYKWLGSNCASPSPMFPSLCSLTAAAPAAAASPPATTGAPGTGPGAPPAAPASAPATTQPPPQSLAALLQAAAGASVSTLDADQWSYYYQSLPGRAAIDPTTFAALFFPNGRPSDPSQYPALTAAQFVTMIGTKGLSAFPVAWLAPSGPGVPASMIHRGWM